MKFNSEKEFKLIGFIERSKIDKKYLISNVEAVFPEDNIDGNVEAFHSLVKAMLISNWAALAWIVKWKNLSPKLVVLLPKE